MELNKRVILLISADIAAACLAIPLALLMTHGTLPTAGHLREIGLDRIVVFVLLLVFVSFILEIYKYGRAIGVREIAAKIVISLLFSFVIISALYFSTRFELQGRGLLALAITIFGIFQFISHTGYSIFSRVHRFARRVLIVGSGRLAGHMGGLIPASDNHILSGYIRCSDEKAEVPEETILENSGGLMATARRERADKIVVSLSERRGIFPLKDVMACKLCGIEVMDAPSFYEQMTGKLLLESITPSWFIFSEGFKITSWRRVLKRILDLILSTIGLILTLPFFPLIALAIRLDSPGPILFRQERVGEMEKTFHLYKFRTMREDAEQGTGAVWSQEKDPRVTRVGAFFRKSRIDEIPQLFNVLMGNMSMVGPRPERPEFVEKLKNIIPYYSERHFIKPGVTGWAQVRYPYGASVEDALEKLRYDLYYIKNISLTFDMVIILETISVVLYRRGR